MRLFQNKQVRRIKFDLDSTFAVGLTFRNLFPDIEEEKCRPLDHLSQIPLFFDNCAWQELKVHYFGLKSEVHYLCCVFFSFEATMRFEFILLLKRVKLFQGQHRH